MMLDQDCWADRRTTAAIQPGHIVDSEKTVTKLTRPSDSKALHVCVAHTKAQEIGSLLEVLSCPLTHSLTPFSAPSSSSSRICLQSRVLCAGSDPVHDSPVLLFRFNSFGEPNPKATHRLLDSGGGKTLEIRQKYIQTEKFPQLCHSTLACDARYRPPAFYRAFHLRMRGHWGSNPSRYRITR